MKNADQPAYPKLTSSENSGGHIHRTVGGLTKREMFAAMAMQGMLANSFWGEQDVAEQAIRYADKLLKQLES